MKVSPLLAVAAAALAFSLHAAATNADDANKVMKESGCTKCHAVDKDKKGPSLKKIAAKYKGKADAEDKLAKHLTTSPMVEVDGVKEEHKSLKTKDAAEVKNVVQWILAQ